MYTQKNGLINLTEPITKLVDQLIGRDKQIKMILNTALQQLEKYKRIKQIKDDIEKKDHDILLLQSQLKEAETVLATALFQADKKLEATEQAKEASVSCEELIKFAFRISSGNSVEAPPDWLPGDPRRPYPLDIEMRCGALGQMSQKIPPSNGKSNFISNPIDMTDDFKSESLLERQDSLPSRNESTTSRNSGIWQAPSEDVRLSLSLNDCCRESSMSTNRSFISFTCLYLKVLDSRFISLRRCLISTRRSLGALSYDACFCNDVFTCEWGCWSGGGRVYVDFIRFLFKWREQLDFPIVTQC
ncbi:uncharacterized protein LOC130636120 isoform X2 [Hydractinia symbiolongicarpus]|nr:uncharacterized protein LOC130636120 isoform X2 [Hydractinia symbiolongicarpus]XP_057301726.1 uncharacterized protein LOC130636120 isoform X2 [Hydractinia symbiolongicarpus]